MPCTARRRGDHPDEGVVETLLHGTAGGWHCYGDLSATPAAAIGNLNSVEARRRAKRTPRNLAIAFPRS